MPTDAPPSVEVIEGDITRIPADAIVNAANSGLAEGGGVCGAIFRAAGYEQLAEACRAIGSCATGAAVITPAFDIKTARYIVHAVGPVYSRYPEDEARRLLASTYRSAIDVAAANGCASIAFPAISTGIYGYPLSKAARVAAEACREGARTTGLRVLLVAFDQPTAYVLRTALAASEEA